MLKNITPKREKAASKRPCPRSSDWASNSSKVTCKFGAGRGRRRATSSIGFEISTPIGGANLEQTLQLALNVGPLGAALRENPERAETVADAVRDLLSNTLRRTAC